jgi:general secretion pathway protein D
VRLVAFLGLALVGLTGPTAACAQYLAPAAPAGPPPLAGRVVWTTAVEPPGSEPAAPAGAATDALDQQIGESVEIVPLRYADVSEVAGILTANQSLKPNDSFSPQEPGFGSSALQGGYFGAGVPTPSLGGGPPQAGSTDPLGQSVDDVVGVDRRLNAIILRGSSERIAALKALIGKLDVAVDSVELETVFVELTQTGARNVGLDFNNANNQIATVSYSYSGGDVASLANTAGYGGVSASLQAAIYAQISKGNGRIVSRPRISAQSGSTAKIVTGDALPILTSIAVSGVNAIQQEVQYVNVGVTLQIAPRVSDDGFVTTHVFAVVSSVTGYSQGYPTISQREATTSATVRDGETFVVGGLTQESDLKQHVSIPGLGEVPALGRLFGLETGTHAKTELYIVVTPHVVRRPGHAAVSP